ncbi:hypothetical protein FS837_004829 [Tulasnella sp. UAMH 9824]|nr:hypothetical protein FS837_004829 [Tulasnella sp. UAMH 9824]
MYRIAAKPVSRSLFAFGAASAAAVAVAGPVYADELKQKKPVVKEKLSIYPKPDAEILLVETNSPLATHIGIAREHVTAAYYEGQATVQSAVDKWIGVEHAVEKQVKELIPKDEPMTPGLLYVGVATLTASVIGRRRSLPVRLVLPPVFFAASLAYFLPKTSHNVSSYLSSLEETYFPGFAAQHAELNKNVSESVSSTLKSYAKAKHAASDGIRQARQQLEQHTGLKVAGAEVDVDGKLKETEAKGASAIEELKTKAVDAFHRIEEETRKIGDQAKGEAERAADGLKKEEEPPKRLV